MLIYLAMILLSIGVVSRTIYTQVFESDKWSAEKYKIIKTEKSPQSVLLKKVVSSCEGHIGGVVYDIFTKDLLQGASIELLNENNNIIKQTK